jgi:aminoglycoside phosphotransferase (APT) family kinase protein
MHAAPVKHLLPTQFPRWADLPIRFEQSGGTDNAIFRLGDDMALRLPPSRGTPSAKRSRAKTAPDAAKLHPPMPCVHNWPCDKLMDNA